MGLLVFAELVARRLTPRGDYDCRSADAYVLENVDWSERYYSSEWRSVQRRIRWEPFSYWRGATHRGEFINIDESGLRRTAQPPADEGQAPAHRVFLLGGSTMWGAGVRDQGTIPSHVASLCARRGTRVDAVNYGQLGYVSTQELITVIRALDQGERPDVVITYDGYNDVLAGLYNGKAGLSYHEDHRGTEFNLLLRPGSLARLLARSTLSLALVRAFARKRSELRGRSQAEVEALADQIFSVEVTNVRCLNALGREFGFEVLAFWQPTIFDKPRLTAFENEQRALIEFTEAVFACVRERLRTYNESGEGPEIVVLDDVFRHAERPYFIDWAHLTEQGNELVAQRIVQRLLPKLRQERIPVERLVERSSRQERGPSLS